ncbi:hypothetical protein PACTADRAFT_58092 [Pachysolen tannophilus NRRL Y-2460]|uniref:Pyridoxamine 5'-phosphate oxidase N-terminal domain-containing protein n=1 Tax=Pachysolen tannophilus NRRL Y-2460 TaxID=669874 RepID=A0A1E4TUE3_PACTA|nr:hypothetical protein PACTADRAFT_58092 [Pachysolen tannophilus NRRL Y-2460]
MSVSHHDGPLPSEVLNLLQTERFVHLATCKDNIPHVSLMNYTYLPPNELYGGLSSTIKNEPYLILTTPTNTKKFENIKSNKIVSLLIHDWITSKKNLETNVSFQNGNNSELEQSSSLLKFLQNLNQSELSQFSATLFGEAIILSNDDESRQYYKEKHLRANPSAKVFIDGDDIAIILVKIISSKVADAQNNVNEYSN